jgi:hypothetical protein
MGPDPIREFYLWMNVPAPSQTVQQLSSVYPSGKLWRFRCSKAAISIAQ